MTRTDLSADRALAEPVDPRCGQLLAQFRDARSCGEMTNGPDPLAGRWREHLEGLHFFRINRLRRKRDVEALVGYLTDETRHVNNRVWAARALLRLSDGRAREPAGQLLDHPDPDLRIAAIRLLGAVGTAADAAALVEALGDPRAAVRWWAADSLGGIGNPAAVEPLSERLTDPESGVRRSAARALGRLGSPAAIPALEDARAGESPWSRRTLSRTLRRLRAQQKAHSVHAAVDGLLEELANDLPSGSAVRTAERTERGWFNVALRPRNDRAAQILVEVEPGGRVIWVAFGEDSRVEIDTSAPSYLDELAAVCRAVTTGHFEETVWTDGDYVLKSEGELEIEGRTRRMSHVSAAPRQTKVEDVRRVRYAPYS